MQWLTDNGGRDQAVELKEVEVDGSLIDVTVAARDLDAGDTVLRIPDNLVVTLDRVFENETVAELLTTDKLSELACLTLYLMYEKKRGEESEWAAFIAELDRQRARGPLAAESPLLWTDDEVATYLHGSPVQKGVDERLKGIRNEYESLDTVWFMSGSLFNNYPYDVPTEAFSFDIFRQAFAAVQAAVVHLQNVPLARRFALLPLGPPCLSYSSTCKALISHSDEDSEVQLTVDVPYAAGERVKAWCGPQPNSKLLINYGIVDEDNPYDKLPIVATVPTAAPLFQQTRRILETAELSTQYTFQLQRNKGLPQQLIPFMRICYAETAEQLAAIDLKEVGEITEADAPILEHLVLLLQKRLTRYDRTIKQDQELLKQDSTPVRHKVALRMLICEKTVLHDALDAVMALPHAPVESKLQSVLNMDNYSKHVSLK